MTKYASKTSVPEARTRDDIEKEIVRFGARQFAYGWDDTDAIVAFQVRDRQVRMRILLPKRTDYLHTDTGRRRTAGAVDDAYAQARRSAWRELLLIIKAKLVAVDAGIVTFEDEWLAYTVMPDGQTVAEHVQPAIETAYADWETPTLLPGYNSARQLEA